MKFTNYAVFLLLLIFSLTGCSITSSTVEQRVVELPSGNPNANIATAEQICRDLIASGFINEIQKKFPNLTQQQMQGIYLKWNEGDFPQSGHSVFITTGISYADSNPDVKAIADFCDALVRKAVAAKFPSSPGK